MNNRLSRPLLLSVLFAVVSLIRATQSPAQALTVLHTFGSVANDGYGPYAGLVLSGNTLFGTAYNGGSNGVGTVFAVNTDGSGYTNLHTFTAKPDGAIPIGGLLLSGQTLYGGTTDGGATNSGMLFAINTNGSGYTNVHNFSKNRTLGYFPTNSDGMGAEGDQGGPLVLSGGTMYGTATGGGTNGGGTVFKVNTNGTGFTTLYDFTIISTFPGGGGTNSDGFQPAHLALSGNTLYGTAQIGGVWGNGTIFAINTDGSGFTNLHSFTATSGPGYDVGTNVDGARPVGGLVLAGHTLYGSAAAGGAGGSGTIFAMNTDGTGFTTLYNFTAANTNSLGNLTNGDGDGPGATLILSSNMLYGNAAIGGTYGWGTLFSVNTNGGGFTNLYNFTGGSDGALPRNGSGLVLSSNILYGTTWEGGTNGGGTVFAVNLLASPPQPVLPSLTFSTFGNQIYIYWSTSLSNTLQFTTNLSSGIWISITNGIGTSSSTNYIFQTSMTGNSSFFRLVP